MQWMKLNAWCKRWATGSVEMKLLLLVRLSINNTDHPGQRPRFTGWTK